MSRPRSLFTVPILLSVLAVGGGYAIGLNIGEDSIRKAERDFVVGELSSLGGIAQPESLHRVIAESLYQACRKSQAKFSTMVHVGGLGDRPGVSLMVNQAMAGRDGPTFDSTYDSLTLVGKFVNQSPNAGDPDTKWTTLPSDTTCIFVGGEKDNLRARLVWKAGTEYSGQIREVLVRFHKGCHATVDAAWGLEVDPAEEADDDPLPCYTPPASPYRRPPGKIVSSMAANASTSEMVSKAEQARVYTPADPMPQHTRKVPSPAQRWAFETASSLAISGGAGPWLVCSTNTCCKIM